MEIVIRKATKEDALVITSFQIEMAFETENLRLDPQTVSLGVAQVFANETLGRYYIAEIGSEVAGSLLITYEWSDWRNAMVLWIQSVYVKPAYRKKGIYKKLYQHIKEQVSHDPTLRGIRLYVDKTNHTAREVYKKLDMNGEHYIVFEWMKEG